MPGTLRRPLFQFITALTLVMGIPYAQAEETRAPNILFISIDDLNDWVGFLGGHPQVKTPNMDRLAARALARVRLHRGLHDVPDR